MPTTLKTFFATPQDAETAFYEALEKGDLDAMMTLWAEDEEIVCIHPGGTRLSGYAAIREGWRRTFEGGTRLQVQVTPISQTNTPFAAIHSVVELVAVRDDDSARAPVVATNVYVRGATGWRMVLHHASPAPPDSAGNGPVTLH